MDTTPCGGVTSYQSDRPLCLGIVVYFSLISFALPSKLHNTSQDSSILIYLPNFFQI